MARKTTPKKVAAAPKKTTRKKSSSVATNKGTSRTAKKDASSRKPQPRASVKKKVTKKKTSPAKKTTTAKKTTKKSTSSKKTTTKKTTTKKTTLKKSPIKKKAPTKKVVAKSAAPAKKTKTAPASTSKKTTAKTKPASSSKKKKRKKKASEVPLADLVPDKDGYVVYRGRRVRVISTKNLVKTGVKKPSETSAEKKVVSKPVKPVTTKLTKKEVNRYRDLIRIERAERMGDLSAMEAEALRSSDGNLSNSMPIHMADVGSDVYEQDFMLGMAESERRLIRELDEALQRVEDGTYGVCQMTKKQIPKTRLNAKPWAKYTIEAARMIENGQVG